MAPCMDWAGIGVLELTKMASKCTPEQDQETNIQSHVTKLKREVEELREIDRQLLKREICCQKAKEWFLSKNPKLGLRAHSKPQTETNVLSKEIKSNMQFLEILKLLSEIRTGKRRLLMLKRQLCVAKRNQERELLHELLLKQSALSVSVPNHPVPSLHDQHNPLALWYLEIVQAINSDLKERADDKLGETNKLFFKVCYENGTKLLQDILAEKIHKKKMKRDERKEHCSDQKLQFSTCYRGFCVQIAIFTVQDDRSDDKKKKDSSEILGASMYHVHSDVQLDNLKENLLEFLNARKSVEAFVKRHVWKEIENLLT